MRVTLLPAASGRCGGLSHIGPRHDLLRGTPRPRDWVPPAGNQWATIVACAMRGATTLQFPRPFQPGSTASCTAAPRAAPSFTHAGAAVGVAADDVTAAATAATAAASCPLLGRRQVLLAVAAASVVVAGDLPTWQLGPSGRAAAAEPQEQEAFCYVAPEPLDGAVRPTSRHFSSLAEAVGACPDGGVVLVAAGRYKERLVLSRPVTVRAWPKGGRVEVVWETPEPYQSTLEVSAAGGGAGGGAAGQLLLEGLTIRHSSKSVANNYGVYIKAGAPRLLDCDISSATGAGVGIEGASPRLEGCRIHDCPRQGIAIFGATALDLDLAIDPDLMYGMTGGVVRGCDVYGNALDGILVRSGASPDLLNNLIHNNSGVGVNLQDCSGRYEGNTVYDNAKGAVAVSALFELDPGDIAGSNSLRGLLRRL